MNLKAVIQKAELDYKRAARRTVGIQERIGLSVPYWLILIALAFFLLSAPHTAATFDRLTPGWGWVAPIAVELSLLYAAFTKRQHQGSLRLAGERLGMRASSVRVLEAFTFAVAVLVNGAGAFVSVVQATGTSDLPIDRLISHFADLPASSQIALALVPFAALIIPIGTGVAGEGVATLILERRERGDLIEQLWLRDRERVLYEALRLALFEAGHTPARSRDLAITLARSPDFGSGRPLSEPVRPVQLPAATGQTDTPADGQPRTPIPKPRAQTATEKAKAYLDSHSDADIEALTARGLAELIGIGHSTAGEALKAWKDKRNGP